jgi:hypothetical protein
MIGPIRPIYHISNSLKCHVFSAARPEWIEIDPRDCPVDISIARKVALHIHKEARHKTVRWRRLGNRERQRRVDMSLDIVALQRAVGKQEFNTASKFAHSSFAIVRLLKDLPTAISWVRTQPMLTMIVLAQTCAWDSVVEAAAKAIVTDRRETLRAFGFPPECASAMARIGPEIASINHVDGLRRALQDASIRRSFCHHREFCHPALSIFADPSLFPMLTPNFLASLTPADTDVVRQVELISKVVQILGIETPMRFGSRNRLAESFDRYYGILDDRALLRKHGLRPFPTCPVPMPSDVRFIESVSSLLRTAMVFENCLFSLSRVRQMARGARAVFEICRSEFAPTLFEIVRHSDGWQLGEIAGMPDARTPDDAVVRFVYRLCRTTGIVIRPAKFEQLELWEDGNPDIPF